MDLIAHRTIGVIYNPGSEQGNYIPPILPGRYIAFLFIDQAPALVLLSGMPGGLKALLRDSDNKPEREYTPNYSKSALKGISRNPPFL